MEKNRILIVEDDADIREGVEIYLKNQGYQVIQAKDGVEGLEQIEKNEIDLAIVDIMMPRMDGITMMMKVREKGCDFPVIMLSAKSEEVDKIMGLNMGADDYITKPFSPSELMARVNSVYRRVDMNRDTVGSSRSEIQLGDFTLNLRNRTLLKGDVPIELTQVEFQIMEYFFSNIGKALKRIDILKHVWGSGYVGEEKIVDVNIRRLRMKIEDEASSPRHIVTVWGVGYRWDQ